MGNETAAVELQNITKRFGSFIANDHIDFTLQKGTIHGLLGENGAGKTTLMNVLGGLYPKDGGTTIINGHEEDISSPQKAMSLGIAMVHQHFMLARPLSVTENVMLGKKSRRGILLDTKETAAELKKLSDQYHMGIDPYVKIWQLSVGEQQRVEILSAIYMGAEILILDEPTAVLTVQETETFFQMLRQMREEGKSIILITHKLDEIMSIADEVTILRDGKNVGHLDMTPDVTKEQLSELMVGRKVLFDFPEKKGEAGAPLVKISGISAKNDKGIIAVDHFSLTVHEGEIVGLAGVDGNGQKELCEVLTGLRHADEGSILFHDEEIMNHRPIELIRKKISYIPEDRMAQGLALNWSLKNNLILKKLSEGPYSVHGFIRKKEVERLWEKDQRDFQIKATSGDELVRALSGGNQQKIILARELGSQPDFLIANQPTRGLDIGASEYVRQQILKARENGAAILLVSADLEEILQLSDRIAVIYNGRLMGILPKESSEEEVGFLMMGGKTEGAEAV